jgi:hypothetical protein
VRKEAYRARMLCATVREQAGRWPVRPTLDPAHNLTNSADVCRHLWWGGKIAPAVRVAMFVCDVRTERRRSLSVHKFRVTSMPYLSGDKLPP